MEFNTVDLGLIDYQLALEKQRSIFTLVKENKLKSTLLICRHNPVITLGRQGRRENILVSQSYLKIAGISSYDVERGGDVTYHGPGQLTAYPIFNLNYFKKDIHLFLRNLEEVVINFLSNFGLKSARKKGFTGVWVGEQKISSIGIAIRNWITFHGVSINIKENDLNNFKIIKPCGMDIEVTSLETVAKKKNEIDALKPSLINSFRAIF